MSTEENKALVRRLYEEWSKGKEAAMAFTEERYAPDYVFHGPPGVFGDVELAGCKPVIAAWFTAFPDLHYTVEDVIAEGDKVVHRFTAHATHRGDLMGVSATGKVVTYTGIYVSRLAGGKFVEDWCSADLLGLM